MGSADCSQHAAYRIQQPWLMAYRDTDGRDDIWSDLESCEVFSLTPLRFSFSSDKRVVFRHG
jgi:hypothetical protein